MRVEGKQANKHTNLCEEVEGRAPTLRNASERREVERVRATALLRKHERLRVLRGRAGAYIARERGAACVPVSRHMRRTQALAHMRPAATETSPRRTRTQ